MIRDVMHNGQEYRIDTETTKRSFLFLLGAVYIGEGQLQTPDDDYWRGKVLFGYSTEPVFRDALIEMYRELGEFDGDVSTPATGG